MLTRRSYSRAIAAWAALVISTPVTAWGAGLAFRDLAGLWTGMAMTGSARSGGAFATRTITALSARAPMDSVPAGPCGGAQSVAAFSAKVSGAAPNTGLFFYDLFNDAVHDAVIEGTPTPIGGAWGSFNGVIPAIALDPATCLVHVVFPGQAIGLAGAVDSGVFDATFGPLPGFGFVGFATVIQEGVTAAPPPFPPGALFKHFPSSLRVVAKGDPGDPTPGYTAAFRGDIQGTDVTSSNNSGLFAFGSVLGAVVTGAREGDATCPPGFTGTMFGEIPANTSLALGDSVSTFGPQLVFVAASNGPAANDTAIVDSFLAAGCGGNVFDYAIEGTSTPAGGTYQHMSSTTPLAAAGGPGLTFVGFMANVSGGSTSRGVFYAAGLSNGVVAEQGQASTALGSSALVSIPGSVELAMSANGFLSMRIKATGFGTGWFRTLGGLPQLMTPGFHNAEHDRVGNMTARFP